MRQQRQKDVAEELEMKKLEGSDVERKLKMARRINIAAIALIAVLLVLMCMMVVNMQHLASQYECLEENYIQLYEEVRGW